MLEAATLIDPNCDSRRHPPKPLAVRIGDACHALGLGRTKLYELIAAGDIKTVRVGGRRSVLYRSIEELLESAPA